MDPELTRYIEYLQRSIATPGAGKERDNEAYLRWIRQSQSSELETGSTELYASELRAELERRVAAYSPLTVYDSASASMIFEPVLAQVMAAAKQTGRAPAQPIIFANSTDTSPGPQSLPSEGEHILFAGAGTYAFCNYWAKLIAWLVMLHQCSNGFVPFTGQKLQRAWNQHPEVVSTVREFIGFCREQGTAIGFGLLPGPSLLSPFRMELVRAMEHFAIAHEVGHFYALEQGIGGGASEELFCDRYALEVCRQAGEEQQNWTMHCGVGGLLFLQLADLCQKASITSSRRTHPDFIVRQEQVLNLIPATRMRGASDAWDYTSDFLLLRQELADLLP